MFGLLFSFNFFFGDWEEHVSRTLQHLLPRLVFYLSLTFIDCGGERKGKTLFRFKNMWLKVEDFVDKIKKWWQEHNLGNGASFVLAKKLQALKVYEME